MDLSEQINPGLRYPGPNETVLEAQARVCTGPHQARPLGRTPADPQPDAVLECILQSARGEPPRTQTVSEAQMGAFFCAMALRKNFPDKTRWSPAETGAFRRYGPDLERALPPEVRFLLHPDRGFEPSGPDDALVVPALRTVLQGRHLTYGETLQACRALLGGRVHPALQAALLIGQRMNGETDDEIRGYVDAVRLPGGVRQVAVEALTHIGEPYNGSARNFKPGLFTAAVRSAMGEASVLHGVDEMPPKSGVTEEQILNALGARTDLDLDEAAALIERPDVGFAYVSQRDFAPGLYALRELRAHIRKRPPWSATEKAQRLFAGRDANNMVVGFYHPGYEGPLLRLMEARGFDAGLAVKGEEGTAHYTLRLGKPSDAERKAVNHTRGFRRTTGRILEIDLDVDPHQYGFDYPRNPRPGEIGAEAFARAGLSALSGRKGPIYDRIVFNAGVLVHLLGREPDLHESIRRAREAVDSGGALARLQAYLASVPHIRQPEKTCTFP